MMPPTPTHLSMSASLQSSHIKNSAVLIDARPLAGVTGISRYAQTLIATMPQFDSTRMYQAFGWRSQVHGPQEGGIPVVSSPLPGRAIARLTKAGLGSPRWGLRGVGLFHGTSYDVPLLRHVRTIMTCHDVAFIHVPETYPSGVPEALVAGLRRMVAHVDAVAVDSAHARADLIDHFAVDPERVRILYPAVVDSTGSPLYFPVRRRPRGPSLRRPYFLVVGELNPRKNLLRIVDAFRLIAEDLDCDLILAGPTGPADYAVLLEERVRSLALDGRVHFVGSVSNTRLASLYDASAALVCCSLYEGFGYPVAEAASRGIPVVASNVASLPEIAGPAALYVDPRSTDTIANALTRVVQDSALRAALTAAGPGTSKRFAADTLATSVVSLYHDLGV